MMSSREEEGEKGSDECGGRAVEGVRMRPEVAGVPGVERLGEGNTGTKWELGWREGGDGVV